MIGLASSGPHSNGFSLIRRLLERAGTGLDETPAELGGSRWPTPCSSRPRIYARAVRLLTATVDVRAMAHITGGGIPGNLARALPAGLGRARSTCRAGSGRPVFGWLASLGVEEDEMRRVFNLGLGYVAFVRGGRRRPRRCGRCETAGAAGLAGRARRRGRRGARCAEGRRPHLGDGQQPPGADRRRPSIESPAWSPAAPTPAVLARARRAAGIAGAGSRPTSARRRDFLERHGVGLVVLAGYMRILSPEFVARFSGRILNVHPSLLPAFPGAPRRPRRAGARRPRDRRDRPPGRRRHVLPTPGRSCCRRHCAVSYDDRPEDVTDRLHEIEHRLLPRAVRAVLRRPDRSGGPACAREGERLA